MHPRPLRPFAAPAVAAVVAAAFIVASVPTRAADSGDAVAMVVDLLGRDDVEFRAIEIGRAHV